MRARAGKRAGASAPRTRAWAAVLAAALALGGLGTSAPARAQSCAAGETAVNFNYIAGFGDVANQALTVPAGVSSIRVFERLARRKHQRIGRTGRTGGGRPGGRAGRCDHRAGRR
ncbi:hypothetical protein [Lysobacter gummosus]|uniref:hypothetical protein n=1 Tax=Lysobacter gummosus TaxID=262324 RepID=UPI00362B22BA